MPSRTFLENKQEILALARTAKASSDRCSYLIGIIDETVALAFDMRCNEILTEWEMESETTRIDNAVAGVFGESAKSAPARTGPIVLNAQVHT